jgi:hypothetical protein
VIGEVSWEPKGEDERWPLSIQSSLSTGIQTS